MSNHITNWPTKKLKNLGTKEKPAIKAGPFGSSLKKEDHVADGYKVYGQEQVIKGDAHFGDYFIDHKKYQTLKSCAVNPGDVLISLVGTMGKVLIVPENALPGVINPRLLRLSLDQKQITPEFTKLFFEDFNTAKTLKRWSQGGTMDVLNADMVGNLQVTLPSLAEQTAIASILSNWDLAIEKAERLIVAKEKRFTSLVKSMITDKCDSWEHLRADKIFKSISEKQNDHEELLSVTQDRGVIPRTMLEGRVMSPESGTDTYKLIKVGDFAISLRSFQGGIEYSRYQGLISPAYTVLRPKLEIDNDFYRHFFKSYLFIGKYLSIAVIGIRDGKQISIPDFMTVKIPLPPIKEQKQIAAILTTARQEIDLLKKQADAYRRQKRGLMQRLLTGVWRVRVG